MQVFDVVFFIFYPVLGNLVWFGYIYLNLRRRPRSMMPSTNWLGQSLVSIYFDDKGLPRADMKRRVVYTVLIITTITSLQQLSPFIFRK